MADESKKATDPMGEIEAMKKVAEALGKLDPEEIGRVLHWAGARYGVAMAAGKIAKAGEATFGAGAATGAEDTGFPTFTNVAELLDAASPTTDAERALVVGYWYQFIEGEEDFPSQTINADLKHNGTGVKNITSALERLKAQKPALILQVRKSGTSQQARKKYKLTGAGKKAVELMVKQTE